jgi:plastocyanin
MDPVRKPLPLFLAAAVAAAFASQALAAGTKSVKVGDNYYVRPSGVPTVTVSKGTTVRWKFAGRAPHNVTVKSGPVKFRSGNKFHGDTYAKKVRVKGTYRIFCSIHGAKDQSMKLVVR